MSMALRRRDFMITAGVAATGMLCEARALAAPQSDTAYATARDLVSALAARRVSAVELLEQARKRIEALDGAINAVILRDFERARDAARAADAALARGERRPLLGLPMTVKESFNVAGLPTSWGIPRFRDWQPAEDAAAVARLKQAGAVVIGKTNLPILLSDWQSYNDVYGTTNNPWDLARTPGGSSGGSAAALAAGYVALELGSDIGGSLRAPAHYCGVYSHRPSWGLVPSRGQVFPTVRPLPHETDLVAIGPLARSAGDLALALDVLAGPDEPMAIAYRLSLPEPRHGDLKSFRVLVVDDHPLEPTDHAVRGALDRLGERLARAGATVAHESALLPDLAAMTRTYVQWRPAQLDEARAAVAALAADDDGLAAVQARAALQSHRDWIAADRRRAAIEAQWRALFKEWDVVLCPPMPTPAFPHAHSPDRRARRIAIDGEPYPYQDQIAWSGVATPAGLPATTIPVERSETGLPVGVQIVGPYLEDRTPIALAALLEREFGGFVAPPRYRA
jgi:amidase